MTVLVEKGGLGGGEFALPQHVLAPWCNYDDAALSRRDWPKQAVLVVSVVVPSQVFLSEKKP